MKGKNSKVINLLLFFYLQKLNEDTSVSNLLLIRSRIILCILCNIIMLKK